jgi:hypothetical protein
VLIGGGKSRISSRQASDYLLCADCEDRFNKRGETWVLKICWRDEKTFKLRDALLATKPLDGSTSDTRIYLGEHVPDVDPDKLAYFGTSVYWRGAARAWELDGLKVPRLPFNKYEALFRLFLLDQGPWPDKAVMYIRRRRHGVDAKQHRPVAREDLNERFVHLSLPNPRHHVSVAAR